ncbi:TadE/TadG family type IV pilus assembly protein [Geomicrobium sp. JSM 1781026]|uniref:TadE/TadG family type IV pilus assembly protein n=1 Tax=Geomicrobium sp. JSM 1781026 TaxID=3344580 RepID=UPI0035BF63E9
MIRKHLQNEEGAVYPLAGALILVFLALAGLIIDAGFAMYQYTKLTSATDSAAISTLDTYDRALWEEEGVIEIDQGRAYSMASQYLNNNMDDAVIRNVQVNGTNITVNAEATVPVFFMKIFGQQDFQIEAMARASLDDSDANGGDS